MATGGRVSWKGVLLGFVVDVGASFVAGRLFVTAVNQLWFALGAFVDPVVLYVALLALGLTFTALGGYVAGRVAGRSEVLNGGLVGALGILFMLPFAASYPLWYVAGALAGAVPFGTLGGRLARGRSEVVGPTTTGGDSGNDQSGDEGW